MWVELLLALQLNLSLAERQNEVTHPHHNYSVAQHLQSHNVGSHLHPHQQGYWSIEHLQHSKSSEIVKNQGDQLHACWQAAIEASHAL